MLTDGMVAILVVIAIATLIPVVIKIISDIDYKRQITGKRKERRFQGNRAPMSASDLEMSTEQNEEYQRREANLAELRIKSGQNLLGPK
ncbi:hypothetical protein SAMN02910453_1066 [Lachnospiraceae bacterium A10]|jgi:hypothetical protein|nr:hypothetical protein SAMN02910453_1066 [Lachnospiraceae bacterium A10]